MPVDLSAQLDEVEASWCFDGPDGIRYLRRSTRARPAQCAELLAAGVPLVLFWFGGRLLDWCAPGAEANARWREVRRAVTTRTPRPSGDVVWTAGVWDDGAGHQVVLLTGRC